MKKIINGQKGYEGQSMSRRAVMAYEDGEMPKSRWTKAAMLEAIAEWAKENERVVDAHVAKMTKAQLFDELFRSSSWHHTGTFAQVTDFYALDEEAAMEMSREMTDDELAAVAEAREEKMARVAAKRAAEACKIEQRKAYEAAHGFASDTVAAYMHEHPEMVTERTSKKGNAIVDVKIGSKVTSYDLAHAKRTHLRGFDALEAVA